MKPPQQKPSANASFNFDWQSLILVTGVVVMTEQVILLVVTGGVVQQAAGLLAPKGQLLIAGGGTAIARMEKPIKADKLLLVRQRKRNRAKRMLVLQPR